MQEFIITELSTEIPPTSKCPPFPIALIVYTYRNFITIPGSMSSAEESNQVLEDAYKSAFSTKPSAESKSKINESGAADIFIAISTCTNQRLDEKATKESEFAVSFSQDTQFFISSAISVASSGDCSQISAISSFAEYVPIVLKGLDALAQIHPFIGRTLR